MPRKFAEISSKFRFGQEFVEKLGISSNFVDRCLHYFCTILYPEFFFKRKWKKLAYKLSKAKKIKDERECLMNEIRNIPVIFETFRIFFNGLFSAVIVIFI